jgi:hypothetical protein
VVNVAEGEIITIDKLQADLIKVTDHYIDIDYSDQTEETETERITKYSTLAKPLFGKIIQWSAEGMTDYSIANQIGVHYKTLSRWKSEYEEFKELFTRAHDSRNCLTMNSAFKRANGIKTVLKKQKVLSDGSVKDYLEEQYFAPDVNAMDLFLRNNDPDYKQAKQVEITNNTMNNFQLPQLEQELQQIAEKRKWLETQLAVDVEIID